MQTMVQNDENDVQRADLTPYIDAIMERYRPAETAREATLSLSTADVYRAIKDLNPGLSFSMDDVFDAMQAAGFVFKADGLTSIRFKWLMQER